MYIFCKELHTQHYKLYLVLKGQKQNYEEEEIEKSSVSENTIWIPRAKNQIGRPKYSGFNGNCKTVTQIGRNIYKVLQIYL